MEPEKYRFVCPVWMMTPVPAYKCPYCPESFTAETTWADHIKTHFPITLSNKCPYCPETFAEETALADHVKTHFPDTVEYTCAYCPETFSDQTAWINHIQIHGAWFPEYACPITHSPTIAPFKDKASMDTHMETHLPSTPFSCCETTFSSAFDLVEHRRTVHNACPICSSPPLGETTLNEHLKGHFPTTTVPAEVPIPTITCWLCGEETTNTDMHFNEKHLPCGFCGEWLIDHTAWEAHVIVRHPYSCTECMIEFGDEAARAEHFETVHFQCSECGATFSDYAELEEHKTTPHS